MPTMRSVVASTNTTSPRQPAALQRSSRSRQVIILRMSGWTTSAPVAKALLAQGLACALILLFHVWMPFNLWQAALLQALCATAISRLQDVARWWGVIHLLFMPLILLATGLRLAPGWYLLAFLLLLLIYWRTDRSQVPLYLSNATTAAALLDLLPDRPVSCLDLGCAGGGVLRHLARARSDCRFVGIEHAPLPWLWARLRCLDLPNVTIHYGDFWRCKLHVHDVVYAFLSPAAMPRLELWARAQLTDGSWLISNSFALPAVPPQQILELADRRHTRLYVYQAPWQTRPVELPSRDAATDANHRLQPRRAG